MELGQGETLRVCLLLLFSRSVLFLFCCSVGLTFSFRLFTWQVRGQSPAERQQVLNHLESHLADFLSDSKESTLFTAGERRELEEDVQQAQRHCQDLLLNMETGEMT